MRRQLGLGVCILTLGSLVVAPSFAQEAEQNASPEAEANDDLARQSLIRGRDAYAEGRFDEAAAAFQQAYQLSMRPQMLHNVYLARRDQGDVQRAAEALRAYLEAPGEVPSRELLEQRLVALDQQVRERAEERRLREQLEDEATSPWPWITMSVGGAAVIGGVVTGVLTLNLESDLEDRCPMAMCVEDAEADKSTGNTLSIVTDVLLIAGGVTLAAGFALLLLLDGDSNDESAVEASASCDAEACLGTVRGRF